MTDLEFALAVMAAVVVGVFLFGLFWLNIERRQIIADSKRARPLAIEVAEMAEIILASRKAMQDQARERQRELEFPEPSGYVGATGSVRR